MKQIITTSNKANWFWLIAIISFTLLVFLLIGTGTSKTNEELFMGAFFMIPVLMIFLGITIAIASQKFEKLKITYEFSKSGIKIIRKISIRRELNDLKKYRIVKKGTRVVEHMLEESGDTLYSNEKFVPFNQIERSYFQRGAVSPIEKLFDICHLIIELKNGKKMRFSNLVRKEIIPVLKSLKFNVLDASA